VQSLLKLERARQKEKGGGVGGAMVASVLQESYASAVDDIFASGRGLFLICVFVEAQERREIAKVGVVGDAPRTHARTQARANKPHATHTHTHTQRGKGRHKGAT